MIWLNKCRNANNMRFYACMNIRFRVYLSKETGVLNSTPCLMLEEYGQR